MTLTRRKKAAIAAVVVVLVAIFLPPQINGSRLAKNLASSLSASMGRQVKIGAVKFRLLPRPGFDLYDFEVLDDPAFSAEPMLLCGEVTADLRLTSLWHGRLEIANLNLRSATDRIPPSLNLVFANGHWNVESLLVRAEQVPTAPTNKRRAEQRARFPYVSADAGRINFKSGPEKKPYALTNTDFSFWLAAEDLWHFRLEGRPIRSDMNLSDTGTIKIEGDLKRAFDMRQTPINMQMSWQQPQLGQLTRLALGQDKGWRAGVQMSAEVTGTLTNMRITTQTSVRDLHRYDINRSTMLQLSSRCQIDYDLSVFDFHCNMPLGTGGIRLTGQYGEQGYDLALVVSRVPLSTLAAFAIHAKSGLPDDLSATGELDAAFAFHGHGPGPRDWHGTGMTSSFAVSSAAIARPLPVGAIHFLMGAPESRAPVAVRKKVSKFGATSVASAFPPVPRDSAVVTLEAFTVDLGGEAQMQIQGVLTPADYQLELRGPAPLERLFDLGKVSGFPTRITGATGSAIADLRLGGSWANFAPARLTGTARLRDIAASVQGIKSRLLLPEADAQLSDTMFEINHLTARFERFPGEFSGWVKVPIGCQSGQGCAAQFDLHAGDLDVSEVGGLLGLYQKSWTIPFISSPEKLPDFRAAGTMSLDKLKLAELPLEQVSAHVEVGDHLLTVDRIAAKIADGSTAGKWTMDWSGPTPRYSGSGTVTGATIERLALSPADATLLSDWVSGKTNLRYSLQISGKAAGEMLASTSGQAWFSVANGGSRYLTTEPGKAMKFQLLEGELTLDRGNMKVLPGKIRTANRIYDIDGTVSLSDRQTRLRVGSGTAQWQITGALDKPAVAGGPVTAQAASAQSR